MIKVKIKNSILSGKLENNNLGNKREEILTELNEKLSEYGLTDDELEAI